MLIFITIAPLLATGIWFVVSETLLGSEWSQSRVTKSFFKSRKLENLEVALTIAILLVILILITFWKNFTFPIIFLFVIAIIYSLHFLGREERSAKERKRLLDGELPTFIQYLTLMISSGLSPLRAIEIISTRSNQVRQKNEVSSYPGSSVILEEMRYLIIQIHNGATIIQGLEEFVRRTETQAARRFANSMIIALDRGTPLVPVLTSLIRDSRVDAKNAMLRRAGKAEIALMIPIVFLLLPISVLFALFPSLTQLQIF